MEQPHRRDEPPFLKVYLAPLENLAMSRDIPVAERLLYLALARAEPNGHAEFKPGELSVLMGGHRDITAAINRSVKAGRLDPASMSRCLVLPTGLAQPYDKGGRAKHLKCQTHTGVARHSSPPWNCPHATSRHKAHGLCDACYRAEVRRAKGEGRPPWWAETTEEPDGFPEDGWALQCTECAGWVAGGRVYNVQDRTIRHDVCPLENP